MARVRSAGTGALATARLRLRERASAPAVCFLASGGSAAQINLAPDFLMS